MTSLVGTQSHDFGETRGKLLRLVFNSWCHNSVHNFEHNSPTWRVVVGEKVMVGHSTNHNLPHVQVVQKIVLSEFSLMKPRHDFTQKNFKVLNT